MRFTREYSNIFEKISTKLFVAILFGTKQFCGLTFLSGSEINSFLFLTKWNLESENYFNMKFKVFVNTLYLVLWWVTYSNVIFLDLNFKVRTEAMSSPCIIPLPLVPILAFSLYWTNILLPIIVHILLHVTSRVFIYWKLPSNRTYSAYWVYLPNWKVGLPTLCINTLLFHHSTSVLRLHVVLMVLVGS